jgi:hypothetical protein
MPLDELLKLLRAAPFVPFRIHTTDGESFDVTHPDGVLPTARALHVGIPGVGPYPGYYDRTQIIALIHVTRLESLDRPTSVGANGSVG